MVRTGQRILAVLLPDHKVKLGLAWASILAVLCVALSVAISMFGMRGFDMILGNNARSLSFWSAMDQERTTFSRYIQSGTQEAREEYQEASEKTRRELAKLSFDYKKIGADCYARTWSIKSLYENYVPERDLVLMMDQQESGYRERLSRVYRLQGYLTTYAGQLEQMTIQLGNRQYQSSRTMLVLVPVATLFLGILSLSLTWYISALREKHDMERQLADVQLQMLKNQIKPHFLFNTLNLIASMAQIEDAEVTEKMIEALSRLFRYNLKSSESVMPLERELRVVQDYMYLQQMRFGKRIQYQSDCAPETLSLLVPSFVLQPLVENAIKHGLSTRSSGGWIVVRSWMDGERFRMSIADTGEGMSEERLEEVRQRLKRGERNDISSIKREEAKREDSKREDTKSGEHTGTGIGLLNIWSRIHGMYCDGEMEIYSRPGAGTVVQLAFTPEKGPEGGDPNVSGITGRR